MSEAQQQTKESLSNDEIALYDRQIRLWGLDGQRKIKTANILLINLSAVGTEISKNLVLGGIGSLFIIDNHDVTDADFEAQFYISEEDKGLKRVTSAKEKIQDLNPRVKLQISEEDFHDKTQEWFCQFNLVIATELSKNDIIYVNSITRKFNIPFYATGLHGLFGYAFIDLINHKHSDTKDRTASNVTSKPGKVTSFYEILAIENVIENNRKLEKLKVESKYNSFAEFLDNAKSSNLTTIKEIFNTNRRLKRVTPVLPLTLASFEYSHELSNKNKIKPSTEEFTNLAISYCQSLNIPSSILENKEDLIENFIDQINREFAPVSAIFGGVVAQDVINALGEKGAKINNFTVLDGITGSFPVFHI